MIERRHLFSGTYLGIFSARPLHFGPVLRYLKYINFGARANGLFDNFKCYIVLYMYPTLQKGLGKTVIPRFRDSRQPKSENHPTLAPTVLPARAVSIPIPKES